jgi:hypothetical protein
MLAKKQYIFPEGDYGFVCEAAEQTKSKNGDPMIVARLLFTDGTGKSAKVFHNLLEGNYGEFLDACGYEYDPEVDVPAEDLPELSGRAHLCIDTYNPDRPKNKVKYCLPPLVKETAKKEPAVNEFGEPDDVNF